MRYQIDVCPHRDTSPVIARMHRPATGEKQRVAAPHGGDDKMENYQEMNHNEAARKNTALTEPFLTPDGIKVQVFGKMVQRGEEMHPEFRIAKIID